MQIGEVPNKRAAVVCEDMCSSMCHAAQDLRDLVVQCSHAQKINIGQPCDSPEVFLPHSLPNLCHVAATGPPFVIHFAVAVPIRHAWEALACIRHQEHSSTRRLLEDNCQLSCCPRAASYGPTSPSRNLGGKPSLIPMKASL